MTGKRAYPSNVNWGGKAVMAICQYVDKAYPRRSYSSTTYYLAFKGQTIANVHVGRDWNTDTPAFSVEIPCTSTGVRDTPMLIEKARARAEKEAGKACVKVEGQPVVDTGKQQTSAGSDSTSTSGTRRARTAKGTRHKAGSSSGVAVPGTSSSQRAPRGSRTLCTTPMRSPKKASGGKRKTKARSRATKKKRQTQ